MPDLIEQLQQYADAAAGAVRPVDLDRVRRGRTSRRSRALIVAAAAVILLVAGVALVAFRKNEPSVRVTTDPPVQPDSTTVPPDATATTGPATRTLRTSPVTAFTGAEYLVWSGEAGANDTSQRADGFAVDVRTGEVRSIPVAPIDPRSGATGVWTGSELIVCCGTGQADGYRVDTRSAAAWDPATGEWRTLARPPEAIARSYPTSVWTGDLMIVVATGPAAAAYDPGTDRWAEIPVPPIVGRRPESIWTGNEMVVWDSHWGSGEALMYPLTGALADRGWTWAPGSDAWSELPALPEGSRTRLGSIAWTGRDVVVWGQSTHNDALGVGARWTPGADEWRPIAPSPQGPVADAYNGTPGSQTLAADADLDGRVIVKGLDGASSPPLYIYSADTDEWIPTQLTVPGFHPNISLVGDRVLVPDSDDPIIGDVSQ